MDFIQHFLIGKPLEHNAQTSYMVSSTLGMDFFSNLLDARLTVDAETADSELTEYQPGPATDGAPPANAIRPAGLHYDYMVDSNTFGATLALDWRFAQTLVAGRGIARRPHDYDYDNLMIDGNTDEDGDALPGVGGCLYSRPADRSDTFDNVAPRVTLSWQPGERSLLYLSGSTGISPARDDRGIPPAAPAVRGRTRQRTSSSRSRPAGNTSRDTFSLNTALFAMEKDNVILRESNGFYRGQRCHDASRVRVRRARSAEFDASHVALAGTYARHEYAFSRAVEGGETIIDGNDVDTAPRHVHTPGPRCALQRAARRRRWICSTWVDYFLDAANTATYPGPQGGQPACRLDAARRPARQPARRQCLRYRLCGSRRLRLRQLPLFPGARPRAVPVGRLRRN